jgi:hypothetical protein
MDSKLLHDMFFLGLPLAEKILRSVVSSGTCTGTIAFFAKRPTPETSRHEELVARLDQITAQLAALRS